MKNLLIITALIISSIGIISAQNLIGKNVNEIRQTMKRVRPDFREDKSTINAKSLKYIDKTKDNTLIFFLSENKICKYSKFMLDVSCAKNTVDTLTKSFKYTDNLTWLDKRNGKDYEIKLLNNEWYFTLQIYEKK